MEPHREQTYSVCRTALQDMIRTNPENEFNI